MSYFLAIEGPFGRKPLGRTLYPTKQEALSAAARKAASSDYSLTFLVMDADHEPGKSLLRDRHERLGV